MSSGIMRMLSEASTPSSNSENPSETKALIFGLLEDGDMTQVEFDRVMGIGWRYTSSIRYTGKTIFHIAMHRTRPTVVRALIAAGVNETTEVMGEDGWSYAAIVGCYARGVLLRELPMPTLPAPVKPGTKCAMSMAIVNKNLEGIQTLYNLDPRPVDEKIAFMVHRAIKDNKAFVLLWLTNQFPQALTVRYHGHTPLGTACRRKSIRMVMILLQLGCPASDATRTIYKDGRTAMQLVRRSISVSGLENFNALLSLFPDDVPHCPVSPDSAIDFTKY